MSREGRGATRLICRLVGGNSSGERRHECWRGRRRRFRHLHRLGHDRGRGRGLAVAARARRESEHGCADACRIDPCTLSHVNQDKHRSLRKPGPTPERAKVPSPGSTCSLTRSGPSIPPCDPHGLTREATHDLNLPRESGAHIVSRSMPGSPTSVWSSSRLMRSAIARAASGPPYGSPNSPPT